MVHRRANTLRSRNKRTHLLPLGSRLSARGCSSHHSVSLCVDEPPSGLLFCTRAHAYPIRCASSCLPRTISTLWGGNIHDARTRRTRCTFFAYGGLLSDHEKNLFWHTTRLIAWAAVRATPARRDGTGTITITSLGRKEEHKTSIPPTLTFSNLWRPNAASLGDLFYRPKHTPAHTHTLEPAATTPCHTSSQH